MIKCIYTKSQVFNKINPNFQLRLRFSKTKTKKNDHPYEKMIESSNVMSWYKIKLSFDGVDHVLMW